MANAEIAKQLAEQNWKFARTYANTSPHEYLVEDWNVELFAVMKHMIKYSGYDKDFYGHPFRYLDLDGYKYWSMGNILNREPIKGYSPQDIEEKMK